MADRRKVDAVKLDEIIAASNLDPFAEERVREANIEPEPEQSRGHGAAHDIRVRAGGL